MTSTTVVVRWARIDGAPVDAAFLEPDARDRCRRFRHDADRRRFVGARLLLRHVVAEVVGCAPADVALHQRCARCGGPHGAPSVEVNARRGPDVSVSHAGDVAMVALASAPVGIDVEPSDACADTRDWVRREAVLKATSLGLDVDPRLVEVSPSDAAPRVTGWRGPGRAPAVRLWDVETEPGYLATIAVLGRRPRRLDIAPATLSWRD